jgi:hypothetical protein
VKAPELPATEVDPADPVVPSAPRSMHRLAAENGWWARLTKAIGWDYRDEGRKVWSVALAMARGEERIVAIWRYNTKQGKWEFGSGQDMRTGELLNSNETKARLR